jgi:hypothetical protein
LFGRWEDLGAKTWCKVIEGAETPKATPEKIITKCQIRSLERVILKDVTQGVILLS